MLKSKIKVIISNFILRIKMCEELAKLFCESYSSALRIKTAEALKLNHNYVVCNGIFKGTKLLEKESWGEDLCSKILGTYEMNVLNHLEKTNITSYDTFVDVGCADGYYLSAIGNMDKRIRLVGIDTNPEALIISKENARLNDLTNSTEFSSEFKGSMLTHSKKSLVMIDIEGSELKFIKANLKKLKRSDLIIETHDRLEDGITENIKNCLQETHFITIIPRAFASNYEISVIEKMSDLDSSLLLCENRVKSKHWISAISKEI